MSEPNANQPPKESWKDKALAIGRAGVSTFPFVGGPALELVNFVLSPPIQKRQAEWLASLAERLQKLEDSGITPESLSANEGFIDNVIRASQAAVKTSQKEKLEALRNAVENSASPHALDASKQEMFIGFVESLSVHHLLILKLLASPRQWLQDHPEIKVYRVDHVFDLIGTVFPELKRERELTLRFLSDLQERGLMPVFALDGQSSASEVYAERITDYGKEFLAFISPPST